MPRAAASGNAVVVIPSEERAPQPTASGAQHFISMASASLGACSLQVTGKGHLRGGSKHLSSCKHNEKGYHLPKARCWLDLAPLSPRTALQTNPLSDLDGNTELAEPPLAGMMRLPRTMRHRLERDARG